MAIICLENDRTTRSFVYDIQRLKAHKAAQEHFQINSSQEPKPPIQATIRYAKSSASA